MTISSIPLADCSNYTSKEPDNSVFLDRGSIRILAPNKEYVKVCRLSGSNFAEKANTRVLVLTDGKSEKDLSMFDKTVNEGSDLLDLKEKAWQAADDVNYSQYGYRRVGRVWYNPNSPHQVAAAKRLKKCCCVIL